jgi:hypothetical protein
MIGGDDFGRAIAQDDMVGTGIGALSTIPVVGKPLGKGIKYAKGKLDFDPLDPNSQDLSQTKLFHGTSDVIDKPDINKTQAQDAGFMGQGFYMTGQPPVAQHYAEKSARATGGNPNIHPMTTKADASLVISPEEAAELKRFIASNPDSSSIVSEKLKQGGYDSIAIKSGDDVVEMNVFDPDMVESKFSASLFDELGDDALYKFSNINPEYIDTIDELGGMPSPSIGISKIGQPLESYGDISLVGRSDAFAKDPTFAADIYSPRQPKPDIDISSKKQSKETDRLIDMVGSDYLDNDINLGNDPFDEMYRNPAYVAEYAKSKGIDITPERFMNETDELRDLQDLFGSDLETIGGIDELTDVQNKAARKYYTRQLIDLQEKIKQPSSKVKQANLQKKIDANKDLLDILFTDGRLNDTGLDVLKGSYNRAKSQSSFRARDARDQLMNELGDDLSSYGDFINDKLQTLDPKKSLFDQDYFYNTGERRSKEYNLENLTKMMTSGGIRNKEGVSYGVGSTRAEVTPQLKNLKDIQDNRGRIIPSDEFETIKADFENQAEDLLQQVDLDIPSYEFMQDLSDYAGGRDSYISELPSDQRQLVDNYLSDLESMPTEYFEVKPQRAVDMSEFYGAAVPKGTSSKVIAQLEEKGLQIEYYDPSKGRKQAIENLNTKAGGGILFSGGGIMFLTTGDDEQETEL